MERARESSSLGSVPRGTGVDFGVFSSTGERVELCLFGTEQASGPERRVEMHRDGDVFRARVEGLRTGSLYGFRVHGEFDPARGLRHNPEKLLLDPYAKRIVGPLGWHAAQQGSVTGPGGCELHADRRDSAPVAPRSVVVDDVPFDWRGHSPPRVPWGRSVLYECHVKGMTALHPELPPELRGTYLGLCAQPVVDHLLALGVTTLSLLPVQERYHDRHLTELGLSNYWGYAPLGLFAPRADMASVPGSEIEELKTMVRALHAAGIEVLLDVVYNHSAESDRFGPTLSLRGLDNAAYYRLREGAPWDYENLSGCGNTLRLDSEPCRRLVLDSMRYWAGALHVDGFRFDLAVALERGTGGAFDPEGGFMRALRDDPLLGSLKLVAEPWDLGADGYRLGAFPAPLREWNDRFRDDVRRFVRGDGGARAQLATRLAGSSDVFGHGERDASAGVNFVTCHDGFTLWDLVSHERKHNDENAEQGRDGRDDNLSSGWGVEGETDDPRVLGLRTLAARCLLLALGTAKGVPMLSHGDELGRTQRGNNNAYCHDGPLTWVHWDDPHDLLRFTRGVLALRRRHPALCDGRLLHGRPVAPQGPRDLEWLGADGRTLGHEDWLDRGARTLAMLLSDGPLSPLADGVDALLCIFHAGDRSLAFALPRRDELRWRVVLDTRHASATPRRARGRTVKLPGHGALVLEGAVVGRRAS